MPSLLRALRSPKSVRRDSRLRRPIRSPRFGRDEDGDGPVVSFLRKRLAPEDFKTLERLLSGDDEDLGGMVEEDEVSPPYYGKYGQNVRGPLDFTSKEERNQGGYRGAADAAAFFRRFPDAERLR